jgi:hypothetical protein
MGRPHLPRRQTIDVWLSLFAACILYTIIIWLLSWLSSCAPNCTRETCRRLDEPSQRTEWICLDIFFFAFFFFFSGWWCTYLFIPFFPARAGRLTHNNNKKTKLPVHDRIISDSSTHTQTPKKRVSDERCARRANKNGYDRDSADGI